MAISTDLVIQEQKGIKKSLDDGSQYSLEQFMSLPTHTIESTDEWSEIFTSTESITGARKLTEQETPDVNALEDGRSTTLVTERYGNAIEVSETVMQKADDSTTKVRSFLTRERDRVLRDLKELFVRNMHQFYNEAFDSGSDLLAPDGVELCGSHTWNTAGATAWDNSATAVLSETAVDAAMEFGGAFLDGGNSPDPQTYNTIVVKLGTQNARTAKKLFAFGISPTAVGDINIYKGEYTIIETPYISATNKNYWFMFAVGNVLSPLYMGIKQFPTMKDPIVQNNESVRSNVTGFWKYGINFMPKNVYGSDGTT